MTKNKKKLFIMLSILPFVLAVISLIVGMFSLVSGKYGKVTTYDFGYYLATDFWWVFLAFTPLSLIPIVAGIKQKDRVVIIIAAVLAAIMAVISFINLNNTNNYSTSIEQLTAIEDGIDYLVPDGTTILAQKNASSFSGNDSEVTVICEGVIRLPDNQEAKEQIEKSDKWSEKIDESVEEYLPEIFAIQAGVMQRFSYYFDQGNRLTFLAYASRENLIYFIVVETK